VLRAPFPWFGGKRKVAAEVWRRFGCVENYVEPFFGSGAVLLGRPQPFTGNETINDADGLVANFWRAVAHEPDTVAFHADNPVNENDLHARHVWLVGQLPTLRARMDGNPEFYDPKIAGWWVWGISCWIGSGFCSGSGPWHSVDGQLVHLGDNGRGAALVSWFSELSARLRNVRVASGDWSRVCGPSVTHKHGLTGVFLDPPYADTADRQSDLYRVDCESLAHDVRRWAIEQGARDDMRIALCGYDGEHEMPDDWAVYAWNAGEGFGGQADDRTGNGKRERIWFSPACITEQPSLFEAALA
jgi:DNA adenine methylase